MPLPKTIKEIFHFKKSGDLASVVTEDEATYEKLVPLVIHEDNWED